MVIAALISSLLAILLVPILLIRFRKRWVEARVPRCADLRRYSTFRVYSLMPAHWSSSGSVTY
jgi:hypothetical protein